MTLKRFYSARLLRIVPAYWVALTLVAVWPGVALYQSRWWQFYLFGQIYDPKTVFGGLGPAWSLCVEMSFYLVLPFYALVAKFALGYLRDAHRCSAEIAVLAILAFLSILAHIAISHSKTDADLAFTLPGSFYLFAVGMALATISTQQWFVPLFKRWRHWSLASWLIAAAIFVIVADALSVKSTGSVNPVYLPTAFLVLLPAVAPSEGITARLAGSRSLRWLGAVSYAFYLWHQTIVVELNKQVGSVWVLTVASALLATMVAAISYYVIERPFLRLKARIRSG